MLVDAYGEEKYWATFERLEISISKKSNAHRIQKYLKYK